ncbi:MAG: hypothetical protein KBT47_00950, partial [Armatimonadetes bacterium]|nr:hypothetical protein [Candidatus Hippobium faecium]
MDNEIEIKEEAAEVSLEKKKKSAKKSAASSEKESAASDKEKKTVKKNVSGKKKTGTAETEYIKAETDETDVSEVSVTIKKTAKSSSKKLADPEFQDEGLDDEVEFYDIDKENKKSKEVKIDNTLFKEVVQYILDSLVNKKEITYTEINEQIEK